LETSVFIIYIVGHILQQKLFCPKQVRLTFDMKFELHNLFWIRVILPFLPVVSSKAVSTQTDLTELFLIEVFQVTLLFTAVYWHIFNNLDVKILMFCLI
jgi:hypothetical protein